jgi:hypothetical protein
MPNSWVKSNGDKENYSKTTALLYNSSTGADLLKIDISGTECKDDVQFNMETEVAKASINDDSRGNSKVDIESSSSPNSSSSKANQQ